MTESNTLENVMASCSPHQRIVAAADSTSEYVGFWRGGMVYGIKVVPGNAHAAEGYKRGSIHSLVELIGRENVIEIIGRPVEHVHCLNSVSFESGKEYDLPQGSQYIRRMNKKIKFFVGEPEKSNGKKRKFIPVPEGAVGVKSYGNNYQWKMPDGNGGYVWK